MPLAEASIELDPPAPERIDNAAWQLARAARTKSTIYRSEFDGREPEPAKEAPQQTAEEIAAEAGKVLAKFPRAK